MKRILPFFIIIFFLIGGVWAQEELETKRNALRQLVNRAEEGDAKALFDLARLHETGYDSISVDSVKSILLYHKSAELGYGPARNILGFKFYNGEGVMRDLDSAMYWIKQAAEGGDITAASNLGFLLSQGNDYATDYKEALMWLNKAASASVPAAMIHLGDMKRMGLGCTPDTAEALMLYERASEAGVADAQLKIVAMMGYKWKDLPADSALILGLKYYTGNAPVAGVELLENAAATGIPKALALLGDAYSKGIGVPYDHKKAMDFFYRAAKSDDPSAQFIIGEMLEFFPDSFREEPAVYWLEKASEKGVIDSETAYKLLYTSP